MDNPYLQDFVGGAPQGGNAAPASDNPYMQDFHGPAGMVTSAPDKYHARAAQVLDEGKVGTGGAFNTFLHGVTAGVGNRAVAGLHAAIAEPFTPVYSDKFKERLSYENALEDEKYRRASQGTGGTTGEIAGALLNPLNKIGGTHFLPGVAGGALQGAVQNGMDTRTAGGVVEGGVLGAAGGAVGNLAGRAIGAAANRILPKPVVPEIGDIENVAQQHEDAFVNSGVTYHPNAMRDLQTRIQDQMEAGRYSSNNHPGIAGGPVFPALDDLANNVTRDFEKPGPMRLPAPVDVRDFSRVVQGQQGNNSLQPYEKSMLADVQKTVRDFPTQVDPYHVVSGDSAAAGQSWKDANAEYVKAFKTRALRDALNVAEDKAMVKGSGGNSNNDVRSRVLAMRNSRKDWTDDELAGIQAIMGEGEDKFMRSMSKMAPQGGGLMQSLAWINGIANPKTLAAPAVGQVARHISDAEQAHMVDQLDRLMRVGGSAKNLPENSMAARISQSAPKLSGPFARLFATTLAPAPVKGGRR